MRWNLNGMHMGRLDLNKRVTSPKRTDCPIVIVFHIFNFSITYCAEWILTKLDRDDPGGKGIQSG